MRILLVDGDRSEGAVLAGQLGERGHEVVHCFPPEGHSVCVGAADPAQCPVESLGCDVALLVRDSGREPGLREMGAVCAIRRHIPLVEACPDLAGPESSPYGRWSTPTGTAVVEAVENLDSGMRPNLVAAVEDRLSQLPAVIRLGRLPTVAIRRQGTRLLLSLTLPPQATRADEECIVTWAVRALRELDPHALTVDVTVQGRS